MHLGPGVPFLRALTSGTSIPLAPGSGLSGERIHMHDALSSRSASESASLDQDPASREVALITAPRSPVPSVKARTLGELHALLSAIESRENEDAVLPLSDLKVNDHGLMTIPGHGGFALTEWAKKQLAARLGVQWDRWFALLGGAERAAELNLRLGRSKEQVRLRTATYRDEEHGNDVPVLRAFVTPSYSPVSDALLAEMLSDVLGGGDSAISRVTVTDMTVTYALQVGNRFRPGDDRQIGDLQGGILVRNSGVGYAGLNVAAHLERLICLNGMMVPVKDPVLLACIHRGIDAGKLRAKLAERAHGIGGAFSRGAERLLEGRRYRVDDREAVFLALLSRARLPRKRLDALEAGYQREPDPTAFGIVQAVTRASQDFAPEARYDLERAATGYLAGLRQDD